MLSHCITWHPIYFQVRKDSTQRGSTTRRDLQENGSPNRDMAGLACHKTHPLKRRFRTGGQHGR